MVTSSAEDLLEYMALEARISLALTNGAGNYEHFGRTRGHCNGESISHWYYNRWFLLEVLHAKPDLCDAAIALFPHYPADHMRRSLPSWLPASSASASMNRCPPKRTRAT
eukprot:TRINITY_DN12854_c0_g1_i1.p2 TRINITY_DN12854_c0_g1~~TRINITY_DN12854_c0_g1_i1.p2  ORF type:complete len:110 (-),score=15.37 TRINITY_DN12854_c0_g1_i1:99-428(-)